jgi:hypothetical protein
MMMQNVSGAETTWEECLEETRSCTSSGKEEDVSVNSHSANEEDDQSSVAHSARPTKLSDLEQERRTLARHENKAVGMLRVIVFLVLSIAAAIVAMGVYRYTANDQQSNFETDFDANAARLLESFHESVERKLEAVDALAVTVTSHAMESASTWPNVTLPDFAVRAANTRILADCVVVNFYPLVTDETRKGWEAYEIQTRHVYDAEFAQDQMQQALQDARFNRTADAPTGGRHLQQAAQPVELDMFGLPLSNLITNMQPDGSMMAAPQDSGPYLPVWQTSPLVPLKSVLNFNALSHPAGKGAYEELIRSKQAVLGMADNLNQEHFGQTGLYFKLLLSMSQYRGDIERYLSEPTSSLAYPIFDSLDPVTRTLVGVMGTNIYWRVNFQNVLPPNARGVICVISNTLNQAFTYRIDGEEPTFLGNGDLHDPTYDEFVQSADVGTYLQTHTSIETRSYSSVDLNEDYCGYSIHIYPSQDTEDQFINDQPFHFSLVVVCVFCFTSLVFITYDCSVARRQRIVMDRAVASSAIVSSLFPPLVRQQLYQESMEQHHHHHQAFKELEQARQQPFNPDVWKVDQGPSGEGRLSSTGKPALTYSKPIANLFHHTTVLFADMAGFTAWSASHTPEQVFELLETLYSAFDEIADRRKVFKVERIGDCYVAVVRRWSVCVTGPLHHPSLPHPSNPPVLMYILSPDGARSLFVVGFSQTGLPEPQEDHAAVMVKFARDILSKMVNLTREFSADLQMRVGVHSGSVTGTQCLGIPRLYVFA